MLQDIFPHVYHNEMSWKKPEPEDVALIFTPDHKLYCKVEDDQLELPRMRDLSCQSARYAFAIDETAYYLTKAEPMEEKGFSFLKTRFLRDMTEGTSCHRFAAAAGESLYRWYRTQQFCGCCGEKMTHSDKERAMVCPNCKHTVYPKICPAVIVAVCNGDRLLLTKYAGRSFQKYALIAGFNEIGESIERTVHREVMEEVGLRVKNLRFYKSQPWVFTDTLLMGFFCDLDGEDTISLQESELSEGGWFSRKSIPRNHSGISLTGEMIEQFRLGKERAESPSAFSNAGV